MVSALAELIAEGLEEKGDLIVLVWPLLGTHTVPCPSSEPGAYHSLWSFMVYFSVFLEKSGAKHHHLLLGV